MSRSYLSCPHCHKRMVRFEEDADGERLFYYCPYCACRVTYQPRVGGMGEDWPKEVFVRAAATAVLTPDGGVHKAAC